MANILILNSGLNGIFNASLAMANRLKCQGHNVDIGCIKDREKHVRDNCFEYFHINAFQVDYRKGLEGISLIKKALISRREYFDSLVDELDFKAFEEHLIEAKIDLVIIDVELHEYIIFLNSKGMPFLLLNQWFSGWQAQDNLPLSSSRLPKSSFQQHSIWAYSRFVRRTKSLIKAITSLGINRRNFILYLAKQMDFDLKFFISYQFPMPFIYKSFPVLSSTHPALEFNKESCSDLFYIYPMVHDKRIEHPSEKFLMDFDFILNKKENENVKLILVTLSSMTNSDHYGIEIILSVLSEMTNYISIISIGPSFDKYGSWSKHKNLFLYESVPQITVLKHADISINHGGIHTINECIHFNIPMLVISGSKYDQNGCAVRISNYGCGISLSPHNLKPDKLIKAIHGLMEKDICKEKMLRLHNSYKKSKSNKIFENYVEEYLVNT